MGFSQSWEFVGKYPWCVRLRATNLRGMNHCLVDRQGGGAAIVTRVADGAVIPASSTEYVACIRITFGATKTLTPVRLNIKSAAFAQRIVLNDLTSAGAYLTLRNSRGWKQHGKKASNQ
jgi:hypothetical protein